MKQQSSLRCRQGQVKAGWYPLLLAMLLLLPLAEIQAEGISGQGGEKLSRLVQIVAESDENAKQDFTWIALSELTAAYEKAFSISASEALKGSGARQRLTSWRNGTRRYISELHGLLERLAGSGDIQMQAESAGPPVIYIDGEPVIISGPEISSAMLMEKRIVDTYCELYDCSELVSITGQRSTDVLAPGGGIWTLKNFREASYVTPDGLIFTFSGVSGRSAKQQLCEALAAELRSLVAGLRDVIDAGHPIDWNSLEIQPLAGAQGHRVVFNGAGEYLRIDRVGFAQIEPLLPGALTWIKHRSIGATGGEVEIFADRLLHTTAYGAD